MKKSFLILSAILHVFTGLLITTLMVFKFVEWWPNKELAMILLLILVASYTVSLIHYFTHNKDWFRSKHELDEERKKFYNAYSKVEDLREKYVSSFESELTYEEYRKKNSITNVSGVGIQKP